MTSPWPTTVPPAPDALPADLAKHPRVSQWLRFPEPGLVAVTPGKVEIGQGILTALVQIASDELDVAPERIRLVPATTGRSPDEGVTSGSLSVQQCGLALRVACAEARAILLGRAAERLGRDPASLSVEDGTIVGPGNARVDYWELTADAPVDDEVAGRGVPKSSASRRVAGSSLGRVDIADKVFGRPRFIHDLAPPGLRHGRVLRPDRPGAMPGHVDEAAVRRVPGVVALVRDSAFLGLVAETEAAADRALERLALAVTWTGGRELPDEEHLDAFLRSAPSEATVVERRGDDAAPAGGRRFVRRYGRPYIAHGSIAPSCALARFDPDLVHVWTHSQGVYNLRADIAGLLRRPPESVVVAHAEGAGCYGHNGADDVALDAVLLARAVPGRPVRLQWTRADELARAPVGAAMAIDLEARLDEGGRIVEWRHDTWSNGHTLRPGRAEAPVLLAASEVADGFPRAISTDPPPAAGGGQDRNAVPLYDLPRWTITRHRLLTMPIRTSALRSLGAFGNIFAIESFLDELAAETDSDPLAFRLRHLADPRGRAVLERAAAMAGWERRNPEPGQGFGLGFARYKNTGAYCAVVAEIEAEEEVRVRRLSVAVDVGEVVNPDGVVNQIEGGAIQATSWTIREAVRFDRERVTSDSWDLYPILRFSEVPAVDVEILARPDEPPLGAGEAAHGPVAAAIGNALAVALGIRVRHLPLTRERIVETMQGDAA